MILARLFVIFLLFMVFIGLLIRVIIPWRFKKMADQMKNEAERRQQDYRNAGKSEGDVSIDKKPPKKDSNLKDEGEYVDYEEVD